MLFRSDAKAKHWCYVENGQERWIPEPFFIDPYEEGNPNILPGEVYDQWKQEDLEQHSHLSLPTPSGSKLTPLQGLTPLQVSPTSSGSSGNKSL